jgi:hypothetical protein
MIRRGETEKPAVRLQEEQVRMPVSMYQLFQVRKAWLAVMFFAAFALYQRDISSHVRNESAAECKGILTCEK